MKQELTDTIEAIGRRGELEEDKLFCLLLSVNEKVQQEIAEDPTFAKKQELEQLRILIEEYRTHFREGRGLFDQLIGLMRRMERKTEQKYMKETAKEYPADTLYHLAVAEQEEVLKQLYPSRFKDE